MQATIQGALGSAPLMLIQTRLRSKPDYEQYEEWGNVILHATAFSIILSAPVGLLVIALLGPISLKQACHATYLIQPAGTLLSGKWHYNLVIRRACPFLFL